MQEKSLTAPGDLVGTAERRIYLGQELGFNVKASTAERVLGNTSSQQTQKQRVSFQTFNSWAQKFEESNPGMVTTATSSLTLPFLYFLSSPLFCLTPYLYIQNPFVSQSGKQFLQTMTQTGVLLHRRPNTSNAVS